MKKLILVIYLIIFYLNANSQRVEYEWEFSIEGSEVSGIDTIIYPPLADRKKLNVSGLSFSCEFYCDSLDYNDSEIDIGGTDKLINTQLRRYAFSGIPNDSLPYTLDLSTSALRCIQDGDTLYLKKFFYPNGSPFNIPSIKWTPGSVTTELSGYCKYYY